MEQKNKRFSKKEEKAWELTRLWYVIISRTSNAFIAMSPKQEDEWERTFTANTIKKYTEKQIDEEIVKARAIVNR